MPKTSYLKIFGFGFLLFIVTMVLIFIMSLVTGTEDTEYPPAKFLWVGVVIAVLLAACSLWFSRRLHPTTTKQAFTYGVIWAVMQIGFMLFITIPNGTTSIVFGQWSTYLIFVGVAAGPLFVKQHNQASVDKQA